MKRVKSDEQLRAYVGKVVKPVWFCDKNPKFLADRWIGLECEVIVADLRERVGFYYDPWNRSSKVVDGKKEDLSWKEYNARPFPRFFPVFPIGIDV